MTGSSASAAEEFFVALKELRQAASTVSYGTLVREAARYETPIQISRQRLSDWFGGRAVPADPDVVRFLVDYLGRFASNVGYRPRPPPWWLRRHQMALRQRQANREVGGPPAAAALQADRLGRPVGDCDPLVLEVHPAVQAPGSGTVAVLPTYVSRATTQRCDKSSTGCSMTGGRSW
ncbi:MAG: hypothetical protein HKP61_09775 [Dactylosporangium sp.]|nr:hypothetical protein [Dactylosporangium sp.]NNJ61221.1 hypothetical protein [Dactylosporangium sp.]